MFFLQVSPTLKIPVEESIGNTSISFGTLTGIKAMGVLPTEYKNNRKLSFLFA